jgi:Tol biopolymer transport system component
MGEVYRARDTRLDRHVAIKVLPQHIAAREDVRMRFEREAKAISALNHPNICALYDIGHEGDTAYLVMELVEGETLAELTKRGPLPIDRVLRYGIEIATALDRAHKAGIIHRDLKPANIMITKAGVKLLDFGVARLQAPPVAGAEATTVAGAITAEGMIVGTLQYMAPEQLEGRPTDARSDLFSLGCIFYEMVTGKRAFDGGSHASVITAIMSHEPTPMTALVAITPPALERLVQKCLAKSPDDRWESAGDLATELRWISEGPIENVQHRGRSALVPWIAAALALALAVAGFWFALRTHRDSALMRLTLPLDADERSASLLEQTIALSPDGRQLVYCATRNGKMSLWLRTLGDPGAVEIAKTDRGSAPFWSPDGQQIGFVANGKLLRCTPRGGDEPAVVTEVAPGSIVSATWGTDGVIVFSELEGRRALFRVPATGGTATEIKIPRPTHVQTIWPVFVKKNLVAYETVNIGNDLRLHLHDLESGADRDLGPIESRFEIVDGYLLFIRDGSLFAQRVDESLKRISEPVLIATDVNAYTTLGSADFTASPSSIVYAISSSDSRVFVYDRKGVVLGPVGPAESLSMRLSHDPTKAVFSVRDVRHGTHDLWTADLARNTLTQITSTPETEGTPVWSPDGKMIAYFSEIGGPPHVFTMRADGSNPTEITPLGHIQYVFDWSPDGKWIVYTELARDTKRDIWLVAPEPHAKPVPWLKTPFNEIQPRVSPDGKWMAFVSDASGRYEVYVSPFDDSSRRFQVSNGGGQVPLWRGDGRELYYQTADHKVYAVSVTTTPSFDTGTPQLLFQDAQGSWNSMDVSPDGQRFYIDRELSGPSTRPLNVVVNWKQLLEKK